MDLDCDLLSHGRLQKWSTRTSSCLYRWHADPGLNSVGVEVGVALHRCAAVGHRAKGDLPRPGGGGPGGGGFGGGFDNFG